MHPEMTLRLRAASGGYAVAQWPRPQLQALDALAALLAGLQQEALAAQDVVVRWVLPT